MFEIKQLVKSEQLGKAPIVKSDFKTIFLSFFIPIIEKKMKS